MLLDREDPRVCVEEVVREESEVNVDLQGHQAPWDALVQADHKG